MFSVYSATKARYRQTWIVDPKHLKIRMNVICPGPIGTPIFSVGKCEENSERVKTNLVRTIPLGRMASPDEIAKAVSFLASGDSSFVTGIELFVDGGIAQI